MEAMRKAWTDDRLDDMQGEMRRGFDRVEADMREIRTELGAMQRTMVVGFASVGAGVLATAVATVLAAVLS
ncbi:MAG TPA: hypothetical protein VHR18_03730 [Solirubrobacterales bacterium]|jgi:hypothetical protein|nr:hypothetical protein [Solirubrobacterales bacterium]